ncbi:MAG: aminopeptidase [Planctomycetota bacterium]|nr:aminopeptidase [Planctomycetota bacterium]
MHDPRIDRLADVLVRYSTRVKKGDLVSISGELSASPMVNALYAAVLRAGGHPFVYPRSEDQIELLLTHGSDEQISFTNPILQFIYDKVDVSIGIWAEQNSRYLSRFDPKKLALHAQGRKPLMATFMRREVLKDQPGGLRWVGTQYPTQAMAQEAEMSLAQYADFVYRAGLLHLPDPVAAWQAVHERQQRVVDFLSTKKVLRFRVPPHDGHDGTDLTVQVGAPAKWINCSGQENFPDGEVFAGPQGVDGHVNYTFPAVYNGREATGIRLVFKGGRVVDASATKGEDFLFKMLDQDPGARTLGEIAIGTNYGITDFSRNTLFDEKIGGTFHAAVGAGYPVSGNSNESGLHWDMVCDLRKRGTLPGGTIEADGAVFHKDGRFLDPSFPQPTAG